MKRRRTLDPSTLVQILVYQSENPDVAMSSSALGDALGISQQAASKRLLALERDGLISRRREGRGLAVALTEAGMAAVAPLYGGLRAALGGGEELEFVGTVFTGLGEGGYYVSLKGYRKHFETHLGFKPYPGTLNLRLTSASMVSRRRKLKLLPGVAVPGFKDGKRTYGPVKCFRAVVGGRSKGAVLAIERTHYDDTVLEVISPVSLRSVLRLSDGDECGVSVALG